MRPWTYALALACALTALATARDPLDARVSGTFGPETGRRARLHLVVVPGQQATASLLLDGGVEWAGVSALLLAQDPFGRPLTAAGGRRVRPLAAVVLDAQGQHRWPLPSAPGVALPPLIALALPPAGPAGGVSSGWVQVPPRSSSGAQPQLDGQIVVTEFMKDPTTVSDSKGEWLELYNPGNVPVDVEGWVLSDLGSDATVLDNSGLGIPIAPGGYLVLGRERDPNLNGDVRVDIVYTGFTLSNGADEIRLSEPGGKLIDELLYDDGVLWPDTSGRSISLRPDMLDARDNDYGANWCHGSTPISGSNPNTGTPGKRNDSCGG